MGYFLLTVLMLVGLFLVFVILLQRGRLRRYLEIETHEKCNSNDPTRRNDSKARTPLWGHLGLPNSVAPALAIPDAVVSDARREPGLGCGGRSAGKSG